MSDTPPFATDPITAAHHFAVVNPRQAGVTPQPDLVMYRTGYFTWGTYGRLVLPDGQTLYTVEQPWNGNQQNISCIPEGIYQCVARRHNRGGYPAIHVTDVPGRSYILFHIANVPSELRGCIAVGVDPGWYKGQWSVTSSKLAFAELMAHYGGKDFTLEIKQYQPDGIRKAI